MSKTVAIVQSNYIPWKGYFDVINLADEFILLDSVQYTRRDWRNRNQIKTPQGVKWLTIPVQVKGKFEQSIRETEISDPGWGRRHWDTIARAYARTRYFSEYRELLEPLFLNCRDRYLGEVNRRFLRALCGVLDIPTVITEDVDYELTPGNTERLVSLCVQAGATDYLTGPAARSYLREDRFAEADLKVHYMDYSGYPEYDQPYPPFQHGVSILDLLFCAGPEARRHMKSF